MDNKRFSGVIPPVVVPLTQDRKLDVPSFERNINRMIEAGVDGLFILGSSSEVVFSTDERRTEIIENMVRIVDHRVPVLAGIIDTETERMIEHGKRAEQMGVDALVATCPFYALQGINEIEWSFRCLHDALNLPIFAYDIPVCVHNKLDVDMLIRLGVDGVLAGVKDSSGDDVSFRRLILKNRDAGHPLQLLTGPRSWSMGRISAVPTARCRALPTSSPTATSASGRLRRPATGRPSATSRTVLPALWRSRR